jgi:hypothetical protein
MSHIIKTLFFASILISSGLVFHLASATNDSNLPSPLKQFASGIATENIKCHDGLQVIGKRTDGFPACVSSLTFAKLILHGWGYDPKHEWTFDGLNDTYKSGQKIYFGIEHKGYAEVQQCSFPVVVAKYENHIVWQSNLFILSCPPITKKEFSYSEYEWQLGNSDLGTMILNQTGTYSIAVSWFKSSDILIQKNIIIEPQ